jgi:hypothetical protein
MIDPTFLTVSGSNRTRGARCFGKPSIDPAKRRVSPVVFSSVTALAGIKIAFLLRNSRAQLYRFDAERVKKTKNQKSAGLFVGRVVPRRRPASGRTRCRTDRRAKSLSEVGRFFERNPHSPHPKSGFS